MPLFVFSPTAARKRTICGLRRGRPPKTYRSARAPENVEYTDGRLPKTYIFVSLAGGGGGSSSSSSNSARNGLCKNPETPETPH